jgi:TetR/AcrR family transcriptional regulator, cholesterol catabolism regulator
VAKSQTAGHRRLAVAGTTSGNRPEPTLDRVVRIAAELFAARGFDATGIQELSDATGLGRGALYYHIKSKQDLLAHVARTLLTGACEQARSVVEGPGTVVERLELLSIRLMEDLVERREAWVVSMRDWQALQPPHREVIGRLRDDYEMLWQSLLDAGAADGTLRPLEPVVRRSILGLYTSSYRWIEADGPVAPAEIGRQLLALLLDGLRQPQGQAVKQRITHQ